MGSDCYQGKCGPGPALDDFFDEDDLQDASKTAKALVLMTKNVVEEAFSQGIPEQTAKLVKAQLDAYAAQGFSRDEAVLFITAAIGRPASFPGVG